VQPEPAVTQSNGRNRGWSGATYIHDGLGNLVDVEFSIDSIDIEVGAGPLIPAVGWATAATDPAVAILDVRDSRRRVGFGTVLRIDEVAVAASAGMHPATESWGVVQLALTCPPCLAALWQSASGQLTLSDVRASVRVLLANDPHGVEDTQLEVIISPPDAASVDASVFSFGLQLAFPLLHQLAGFLTDVIIDGVAPAVLDSLTRRLGLITPVPGMAARLQPLVSLDREPYRDALEAVVNGAPNEVLDQATAAERLDELVNHTPSGRTEARFRSEFIAYSLALAITEPGTGGRLEYPTDPEARLPGDITLVLSHGTLQYFLAWAGYGVGYQGDFRRVDTPHVPLTDQEVVDFWADAPEPERLGPRPPYRTGPPQTSLLPGGTPADWIGYSGIARVSNGIVRVLPVSNPPPGAAVAELGVTVELEVGVSTFTPVTYEVCEDLTRVADWLDRGSGLPVPPLDPGDPVPPWADGIVRVRRAGALIDDVAPALGTDLLDSLGRVLDDGHANGGAGGSTAPDVVFGRPLAGGLGRIGNGFGHTVACHVVTSWNKVSSESWLSARISMTVPVMVGIGEEFNRRIRFLPLLSYRIDPAQVVVGELDASAPEGPLGGLLIGENRTWLTERMVNHALSLLLGDTAIYRVDHPAASPLRYAYGPETLPLRPEGFAARAFLALHPGHWSPEPATGPTLTDAPPYIAVETFGADPDHLAMAFNFTVVTNLFDRLGG
jgi:hypothetical protein